MQILILILIHYSASWLATSHWCNTLPWEPLILPTLTGIDRRVIQSLFIKGGDPLYDRNVLLTRWMIQINPKDLENIPAGMPGHFIHSFVANYPCILSQYIASPCAHLHVSLQLQQVKSVPGDKTGTLVGKVHPSKANLVWPHEGFAD